MKFDYVVDTSAWLEYYLGSRKGLDIKDIIEKGRLATSIITIAELSDKYARHNDSFDDLFQFINSRSVILPISMEIALESGKIKSELRKKFKQFGLVDAIIYLTAKLNNSILLTGDNHFKGLSNVEII